MNFIKKTALISFMAIALVGSNIPVFAEEAASTLESQGSNTTAMIAETIMHIEKAIVEIEKSDFAASYLHLKAARTSGTEIMGNEDTIKQANMLVIQGQISSKKGEVKQSIDILNRALTLYKSL